MKLLTKEIENRFLAIGSQEEVADPIVVAKFFNPLGPATWFITELVSYRVKIDDEFKEVESLELADLKEQHPELKILDVILFGFCSLFRDPCCDELGYVSLSELESVDVGLSLGIERDMYWRERPLSEAKKGFYSGMRIGEVI